MTATGAVCTACGATNERLRRFCTSCGASLAAQAASQQEPPSLSPSPSGQSIARPGAIQPQDGRKPEPSVPPRFLAGIAAMGAAVVAAIVIIPGSSSGIPLSTFAAKGTVECSGDAAGPAGYRSAAFNSEWDATSWSWFTESDGDQLESQAGPLQATNDGDRVVIGDGIRNDRVPWSMSGLSAITIEPGARLRVEFTQRDRNDSYEGSIEVKAGDQGLEATATGIFEGVDVSGQCTHRNMS